MKTKTVWKEKMHFVSEAEGAMNGASTAMDSKPPFGDGQAPNPKELLVMAVSGCSAMDVASLMKKHKQPVESFEVGAEAIVKEGSKPQVFERLILTYALTGKLDREKVIEAVHLSQTLYCGVSAMLVASVPIDYIVVLNDQEVARGHANFSNGG